MRSAVFGGYDPLTWLGTVLWLIYSRQTIVRFAHNTTFPLSLGKPHRSLQRLELIMNLQIYVSSTLLLYSRILSPGPSQIILR